MEGLRWMSVRHQLPVGGDCSRWESRSIGTAEVTLLMDSHNCMSRLQSLYQQDGPHTYGRYLLAEWPGYNRVRNRFISRKLWQLGNAVQHCWWQLSSRIRELKTNSLRKQLLAYLWLRIEFLSRRGLPSYLLETPLECVSPPIRLLTRPPIRPVSETGIKYSQSAFHKFFLLLPNTTTGLFTTERE